MVTFKQRLKNSSLFRIAYIIDLFFCNIAFLQIPAYVFLAFLFVWGIYLAIYNQRKNNTLLKMRFSIWVSAFLAFSFVTILLNFSITIFYSLLMFLHICICFLIFYGMHTEPDFDFRKELNFIARFIVYATTILNVIGIICLMLGFKFEWYWIKFTIFENRFTGTYVNPNLLGFISVVSLVCCHILSKDYFVNCVAKPKISKIWLASCIITNLFSLMLCDSNASMVLAIVYAIVYFIYILFDVKKGLTTLKVFIKILSIILASSIIISFSLMFRTIFQEGFSTVVSKTNSIITLITDKVTNSDNDKSYNSNEKNQVDKKKNDITFNHENSNLDSGRTKLWKESLSLFKISPIIGISNGNIIFYSEEYANGALKYSYHQSDLHNGFLTILVSTGVIGFLLFCIFGFRFAKHTAQHLFLQKKSYRNQCYPCLFSFLFAYLFYALFEKALLFDISFMVMWFWLFMGYASCYVAKFEPMLETQYLFHKKRLPRSML